jgi:hypothetical protein
MQYEHFEAIDVRIMWELSKGTSDLYDVKIMYNSSSDMSGTRTLYSYDQGELNDLLKCYRKQNERRYGRAK